MYNILHLFLAGQIMAEGVVGLTRSSGLNWQSCPDVNQEVWVADGEQAPPFDCANITVPLDYTNPNSSPLTLNLFRYNATQQPALGSVIINFGGPGGSGAENLPLYGRAIGDNIGPQWNLITWDPRGTGKTIPFDCKINTTASSSGNNKRDLALVSANLTDYFVNIGWDWAGNTADACFAAMNDTGRFISTPSTANDVMAIVDALNEDGMLRYWGWSYGTALGSYLAALFPERIERMVLDGNLNPWDYQSGTYRDTADDIDKAFRGFLQQCLDNKSNCSLAQYTNATTSDDIIAVLNNATQPLIGEITTQATWKAYADIIGYIVHQLYYPSTWPQLADDITATLKGLPINSTGPTGPDLYNLGTEWAPFGIRGADAIWQTNSIDDYLPQVQYEATKGAWSAVYPNLWVSAQWKITPPNRYYGGFNITTKHPILYINGEYDPVTPIVGAYNASAGFVGSVVLAHTGYGHGIPVDPSACVAGYAQAYFSNGTLPPNGTVCHPDHTPWELAAIAAAAAATQSSSAPTSTPTGGPATSTTNATSVATGGPTASILPSSAGVRLNGVSTLVVAFVGLLVVHVAML